MADKKIKLCFGIHNHQPVGNFGWVFEESSEKSYVPFLDVLAEFPQIKVAVHTSGPLLEWVEKYRPDYIEKLGALVENGQVEILGGGFFEPILSIIPPDNALEQLGMMKDWAKSRLGANIRGIWLTERIWEPSLPALLSDAGVEFTICDTTHFQWAGIPKEEVHGYYITEKFGKTVAVFPIDRKLRYTIPFHDPCDTVGHLYEQAQQFPGGIVTYADDGEKFGVWPGTYNLVFEREWLRRFFTELCDQGEQIEFIHFSDAVDNEPPTGNVMLPVASYLEMTGWALPSKAGYDLENLTKDLKNRNEWDRFEPFIRGGFWDNFLVKYPESNRIHKRMLRAAEKVRQMPAGKSEEKALARLHLYRGQCNCAYWHGLFGGLYLNYLRDALTRNLIESMRISDKAMDGDIPLSLEVTDFDADGHKDVILENRSFSLVLSPWLGGACSVMDLREYGHAISNVLARRPEAYHEQVRNLGNNNNDNGDVVSIHDLVTAKEEGLAEYLQYDEADRLCFQDYFAQADYHFEQHKELTGKIDNDFTNSPYTLVTTDSDDDKAVVKMERSSKIYLAEQDQTLAISKKFEINKNNSQLKVTYGFTAKDSPIRMRWACEFNLTLLTKDAPDRYFEIGDKKWMMGVDEQFDAVKSFSLFDGWQGLKLNINTDQNSELWVFPIETVNQSEGGFERTYQGTCFTLVADLDVPAGQTQNATFVLNIESEKNDDND